MENQTLNRTSKIILIAIAVGIWAIVLQNAGVIPTSQNVEVVNTVGVNGSVRVSGEVDANVGNTVDINISEVNGKSDAFYGRPGQSYDAIHVYTGN